MMALIVRKQLFDVTYPLTQIKRFRGKINIQKPRPPHFERAQYVELVKPYFINPKKNMPMIELCDYSIPSPLKKNIDNPFQTIISKELLKWFQKSKLVAFYHMNPMNAAQQYKAYVLFKKQKMHFKNYGKKTLEMAIKETPYEACLKFYVSHNMTVFSEESQVKYLLRVTKKFPQLVLLGAIYEGKLISKDELLHLSMIPNIQAAQAGLVQTLNLMSNTLVTQLNKHQNNLVSNLEERRKQLEETG